jgi:hypothetical protein
VKNPNSLPPKPPVQPRQSLARSVGGLPLPPRLAKPPVSRVMKPLLAAPPKPSTSKPHPPKTNKPAASADGRASVAGKLGSFMPRPKSSGSSRASGKKRR